MVTIKVNEISNIAREHTEQYKKEVKNVNIRTILQVVYNIVHIDGLDEVMTRELVQFEEGTIDIALNLESNNISVVLTEVFY